MAAKFAVVLFAVLALAAANHQSRVKKQVIVGAYPYAAAAAPVVYAEDDGSWAPGKYDPIEIPAAYAAYPYAAAAYPYSAYAAAPAAYAAAPAAYAAAAYPYAAKAYAAPAYAAAAYPYAYAAAPYVAAVEDNGSYFPGKYGPENQ